jgi:hypothetical protein
MQAGFFTLALECSTVGLQAGEQRKTTLSGVAAQKFQSSLHRQPESSAV